MIPTLPIVGNAASRPLVAGQGRPEIAVRSRARYEVSIGAAKPSFLLACALAVLSLPSWAQTPTDGRPRGLYVLDSGSTLANIRNYSFVEGFVKRTGWPTLEPAQGVYDFSSIDAAVAALEPLGQTLDLMLHAVSVPAYVLSAPGVQTWTHPQIGLTAVPWDPFALSRWEALCQALGDHLVPSAAQGGAPVPLRLHPVLGQVATSLVGLKWYRLGGNFATLIPGYDRTLFTSGSLRSIHAMRDSFAAKYAYVGLFLMKDNIQSPPLDEHIRTTLLAEFDGVQYPLLGFFQEDLAASKDPLTGVVTGYPQTLGIGAPLALSQSSTYIRFQALQGWNCPFSIPTHTAGAVPDDGLTFGSADYGCTSFSLNICDIDDTSYWPSFQQWAQTLAAAPHQVNGGSASLLLQGRTGFVPLQQGSSATLELLGAPAVPFAVFVGSPQEPSGTSLPFGLLDILLPAPLVLSGILDGSGRSLPTVPVPAVSVLVPLALQAIVLDPAGPAQATLSGRVQFIIQ